MSKVPFSGAVIAVLKNLETWLEAGKIPHVTIGAVAVSLIAQPRVTNDVDIVIWLDPRLWDEFLHAGARYGFVPRMNDALKFARRTQVLLVKHAETGISVDISCGALPFEKEMIDRAVSVSIGGLQLKIPAAEDLIITKAVADRPKDVIDIESILRVSTTLDIRRIRYWVRKFATTLGAPELLRNLERLLRHYRYRKPRKK